MRSPNYQFVAQMTAAFTVVASLALVAFELKQTREVATAELTIAVMTMSLEQFRSVLDVDSYNRGVYKTEVSGEELTHMERKNQRRVDIGEVIHMDAKHLLWESDLLTDGEWDSQRAVILRMYSYQPRWRLVPSQEKVAVWGRESFNEEMRSLWEQWKSENPTVYKEWLAEKLAAEEAEKAELETKVDAERNIEEE